MDDRTLIPPWEVPTPKKPYNGFNHYAPQPEKVNVPPIVLATVELGLNELKAQLENNKAKVTKWVEEGTSDIEGVSDIIVRNVEITEQIKVVSAWLVKNSINYRKDSL